MKFSIEKPQSKDDELEKDVNLHALSRERSELRKAISEVSPKKDELSKLEADGLKTDIEDINSKVSDFSIEKVGGLSKAKELLRAQKEDSPKSGFIDESVISKELGAEYHLLSSAVEKTEEITEAINRKTQEATLEADPYKRKILERTISRLKVAEKAYSEVQSEIASKNPKLERAVELVEYKKGLHMEGGIAMTPTVKKYVEEIEQKMITGRPIFLHGPTGTGKTSLGKLVAETLTGKRAELIFCNEQTRESDIWGKMGIENDKGTPVTKFVYGKLSRAIQEGKPVIFDEFNRLTSDQQAMIKGLFSYKPGKMVPITGNKEVMMAPGFQIICTANLKSEKHSDRKDLPDEIKREFRQNHLEINYSPVHESYDIMLSRLMNQDGSVDLSWHDLNITLPKLAEAMVSIQEAYAGELGDEEAKSIGAMSASNAKSQLKSFVMTQGSVSDILTQWPYEKKKGKTFAEFIDERLVAELTFGSDEESKEDHILAAKIFALKGFLKTVTPGDLDLPKDIFNGVKVKTERGGKEKIEELRENSAKVAHITLSELADLDPFNVREKTIDPLVEFGVGEESDPDDFTKSIEKRLAKLRGKEKTADFVASAEYVYKNPETGKEESRENIELDIEKSVNEYVALYQDVGLDIPEDFKEQVEEIWSRNYDEIKQAIEEKGFNDMIIAPANIPLEELKEKMKMENGYFTGSNFDDGGGFVGAKSEGVDKIRIILVHNSRNIEDRPELNATLGVKAKDVKIDESLSLEDYIILQGNYFKQTGKHLDDGPNFTWTPRTKSGSRFVNSCWNPGGGELGVNAGDAGRSSSNLGCRPSRYFV